VVEKTPCEIWNGRKPNMRHLKIWGCEAYVKRQMVTMLEQNLTNVSLVDILKKFEDTTFTILLREKLLSLEMKFSLKRYLPPKESMEKKLDLEEIQDP